jgi:hypothetical protein
MPISLKVLTPRSGELGKVKIGGTRPEKRKTKDGDREWQLPQKYDHFIVTTTVRDQKTQNFLRDEALMAKLPKDEDKQCREIQIVLDSDIIEEVFPTSLACYAGKQLFCKGDGSGENGATRYEINKNGTRSGKTKQVHCTCSYLTEPSREGPVCKPHGTLWMTIVAGDETRLGGKHAFRTTSWNSIRSIRSGLDQIQKMVGTIVGIPLWLVIRPHLTQTRDGRTQKIYVVHVELRTKNLMSLQRHAIETAKNRIAVTQLAGHPVHLGLPAPAGPQESRAEQAQVQQEWHPDAGDSDLPEDEEDEVIDYDPETGEVLGEPPTEPRNKSGEYEAVGETPDKPSQRKTDTALPAVGADDVPFEEVSPSTTKPEPEGSELRLRVARTLDGVVRLRGKDARDQKWRKLVFAEACRAALAGREVGWKLASAADLEAVEDHLVGLLERAPLPLDEKPSEPEQQSLVGDEP